MLLTSLLTADTPTSYWPLLVGALLIGLVIYGMVRIYRELMKK